MTIASHVNLGPNQVKEQESREIVWPRGRIVGGSSSINGLIFIRGQKEDYEDWQKLGAINLEL